MFKTTYITVLYRRHHYASSRFRYHHLKSELLLTKFLNTRLTDGILNPERNTLARLRRKYNANCHKHGDTGCGVNVTSAMWTFSFTLYKK